MTRPRRTRSPSHQHIVEDLIEKKNYDEAAYALLAEKIISISLHTTKKSSPPDFHRFRG